MSNIDVRWHTDKGCILLLTFEQGWTWETFVHAGYQCNDMMDTVSHPVIQVFDMSQTDNIPGNMFKHRRPIFSSDIHPNLQQVIIGGANKYMQAVYRALTNVLPAALVNGWHITFADTLEEALALVDSARVK